VDRAVVAGMVSRVVDPVIGAFARLSTLRCFLRSSVGAGELVEAFSTQSSVVLSASRPRPMRFSPASVTPQVTMHPVGAREGLLYLLVDLSLSKQFVSLRPGRTRLVALER
jgi:hypothetical protein